MSSPPPTPFFSLSVSPSRLQSTPGNCTAVWVLGEFNVDTSPRKKNPSGVLAMCNKIQGSNAARWSGGGSDEVRSRTTWRLLATRAGVRVVLRPHAVAHAGMTQPNRRPVSRQGPVVSGRAAPRRPAGPAGLCLPRARWSTGIPALSMPGSEGM
jgi:hypothetical protein